MSQINESNNLDNIDESVNKPDTLANQDNVQGNSIINSHTVLSGMYQDWFLDYASYVILERAVPHLNDGLKPVQRRILHSMRRLDDGRYNKVANIIGHTMQFHPHGDASIGDALVQLGQKDLLVDAQGNWGNILTGDSAAAPRYIEARLSKFANEVVFNPKTTEWKLSYDGRNQEPVTLPVKFPLLLTQGVEGIAVGLASKILPHNFVELIEASIAILKGQAFQIFPDFPTGGLADCSRYNDGMRGGQVKVRARIGKLDKKALVITEIPFGTTTSSVIESILKVNEKGKIKIRKIDDNTAENVEIVIHLQPGISQDLTIDALYALTDCQVTVNPNSCVIFDNKPMFLPVSEILKHNTQNTLQLLKSELEIRMQELNQDWHQASLEKIFIINEIYEAIKDCKTEEAILKAIDDGLKPFTSNLKKPVEHEDLVRLSNIPIKRISKFSSFQADNYLKSIEDEMLKVKSDIDNIVPYTIKWYQSILKKYGEGRQRRTELRSFDNIETTKVVVANEKLYVNRTEGFIGYGLKKDEYVCDCSDIDDILVIRNNGSYLITKVEEKKFVGKDIKHLAVFRKNDNRTIYNVAYFDGESGISYIKRCNINGLQRDKEYFLTQGTNGSKLHYLSVCPSGENEVLRVLLQPRSRLKNLTFELDLSTISVKSRNSIGNILSRYAIHKVSCIERTDSIAEGMNIWFDPETKRLNFDEKGQFLGQFRSNEKILGVCSSGFYQLYSSDLLTHFEDDTIFLEKYNPRKIYSVVYLDTQQKSYYIKRFNFDPSDRLVDFIGEEENFKLVLITGDRFPNLELVFGGKNKGRPSEKIDVHEFIQVKGLKAKGKKLSNFEIKSINQLEPLEKDIPEELDEVDTNVESSDSTLQIKEEEIFKKENPGNITQASLF